MKLPKLVSATMIAAALLTVAACGSDDSDAPPVVSASSSSANGTGSGDQRTDGSKPPSAATIGDMINEALDPSVPNAKKVLLVEGAERDPNIFDKLVQARQDNQGITYAVKNPPIRKGPNRAEVTVEVTDQGSPPTDVAATIVYKGGRWKLSNATVCTLLAAYQVKSALCPGSAAAPSTSTRPSN